MLAPYLLCVLSYRIIYLVVALQYRMKKFFIYIVASTILSFLVMTPLFAQVSPVAFYSMDDCSLNDDVGGFDGFIFGNLCACGASSNGLEFSGNEIGDFNPGLTDVFGSDYTISFYASFNQTVTQSMDILSIAETCNSDTALLIRYLPEFSLIRIRFSDNADNRIDLSAEIEQPGCLSHIVFTVEGSIGRIYINGVLMDEQSGRSPFTFNPPDGIDLRLADSPCNDIPIGGDTRFAGVIDELIVYDRALILREIRALDIRPNQILLNDTTIFEGQSIVLNTGQICTDMFTWSPTDVLSDPSITEPVASPALGTNVFTLTIDDNNCMISDDVVINVVDRDVVSCSDLVLPNTFTPNGDGINDDFGISNPFLIDQLISFEIFDKWGGRIFQTNDVSGAWNGRRLDSGIEVGNSSYVYKVSYTCEGNTEVVTGVVNVLR